VTAARGGTRAGRQGAHSRPEGWGITLPATSGTRTKTTGVFAVAIALAVLAALASLLRGGRNAPPAAAGQPPRAGAGVRAHRAAGG
jgi:hypothetical protein